MAEEEKTKKESFKVTGEEILEKVKEIIKEGNARRIIIRNEKDHILAEFPLTVGAIGVVFAPILAAVGALAAIVSDCTIEVEKKEEES